MADGALPLDDANAVRRPIQAIPMDGIAPAEVSGRAPEFLWVPPGTLLVDETYQRDISERSIRLIRRIVAGWDWARFKPPIVANTPGGLEVIDGQHTAIAAASHGGIREIPVMIVSAHELADRASAFLGHNRDRIAMTGFQLHKSGLQGKDPDALAVQAVCDAASVVIPAYPPSKGIFRPRDCVAFTTLYALVSRRGPSKSKQILRLLAEAEFAPIGRDQIAAVETVLCDPKYAGEVSIDDVGRALIALGGGFNREAELFAASHRLSRSAAAAVVLFRRATRGKRRAA